MMMSYCIIRSKLKKAKQDEEQLQEENEVCLIREKIDMMASTTSQSPEANRCNQYEAVPSFINVRPAHLSDREQSLDLSDTTSPTSQSTILAAKASQTTAMSRVCDGANKLISMLALPSLSSTNASISMRDFCQPKIEMKAPAKRIRSAIYRSPRQPSQPAARQQAASNKFPSTKLANQAPTWALVLILVLLSLAGEQQQQRRRDVLLQRHHQGTTTTHDHLNFLEAIYESFATFLRSISAIRSTNFVLLAEAQYKPEWPSKSVQQEIFLLNLEDGYFGCQVNESQDFLQLFELSRLCDGQTQCYLGTDEMDKGLKCNKRDECGAHVNSRGQQESVQCVNGVCLDGLCYCNDGYGGKSCDVPDENECKFRPCDVFAHCTNTMGSYYCSCFPGKLPLDAHAHTHTQSAVLIVGLGS